jgi:predicted MFS family arabinose efflux permease
VVGALALTEIVSWGVFYYAFGALVVPMQTELGWSQGLLGGAFALALFVAALLAAPVARALERQGARRVMTAGSVAGALVVAAWSWVEHPFVFYALFLALGFPLASTLYEAGFAALVRFLGSSRRTDHALLFLTIVAGFASTVFVPLTQALAERLGWRGALRALALGLAALTIPLHALVLPGAPERAAEREHGGGVDELDARRLRLVASAFALATVAGTSLGVYLVPILREQAFSARFAALAAGLIGVGQVVGRLAFTLLRARFTLASWSLALFLPPALGLGMLASAPGPTSAALAVFSFSMASGGQTLGRAAWTLELFPVAAFARANAVLGRWSLFGRAGAPLALGAAHDLLGSHRPGLVALAFACLAGGWCARAATRRP